jgi:hypothetical protein
MYTNPIFLLGIAAVGVFLYLIYRRQNKKGYELDTDKSEDDSPTDLKSKSTKGSFLIRLADNVTGRIYNTYLTKESAKEIKQEYTTLGRQWDRDGKKVFGINRFINEKGEIKLRPIIIPPRINSAPYSLHNDIQQPEMAIVIAELLKEEGKNFLEKYGQVLWWIAVMAVIAFMWANS